MRMFPFMPLAAFAGVLFAQELSPELAEPAGKYRAAVEAVEKRRLEDAARAAQSYLGTLDQVGKTATAKGDVKVIEAVAKERAAALAGTLAPELLAELPALRMQGARKALLMKLEKINDDAAAQKKRFDGQYLGILATLAAKAGPESALAKQVAAERETVLAGGEAAGVCDRNGDVAKVAKVPHGKNVAVNGDFEKANASGDPEGWTNAGQVTIETDQGNHYIRFKEATSNRDGSFSFHGITQFLNGPANASKATVSARLRTAACVSSKEGSRVPCVQLFFKGKNEKKISEVAARWDQKNGSWKRIQGEGKIPDGTESMMLIVENGFCPGQIDFDDIEVTFR